MEPILRDIHCLLELAYQPRPSCTVLIVGAEILCRDCFDQQSASFFLKSMHELPKELTNSLRSWRGSIYGRTESNPTDLEKGPQEHVEPLSTQGLSILNSTSSNRRLDITQRSEEEKPPVPIRKATTTFAPQTPASAKLSIFHHAPKVRDPDPASDRLDDDMTPLSKEHFYELMGMDIPHTHGQSPKDLARHHGLYGKISRQLRYVQIKYRVFDVFTYLFMALQLLLSAVFIILGSLASVDSHVAIAVLGAVSTVIAGALALMKGQGLPNRLRQVRDDLSNILFEADELYWDVAAERPVLFADVVKLREDYIRVLQEARRNHPDTWRGTSDIAKGIQPRSKVQSANPLRSGSEAA